MYKILIVDDEKMIRLGMKKVLPGRVLESVKFTTRLQAGRRLDHPGEKAGDHDL